MIYRWKHSVHPPMVLLSLSYIQLLTGWEERSSVGTDLFLIYIRRVCMHPYACVPRNGYSQLRLGFGDSPGILISWGSSHATQWVQRNIPSSEGVGEQELGLGEAVMWKGSHCHGRLCPGAGGVSVWFSPTAGFGAVASCSIHSKKGKNFSVS